MRTQNEIVARIDERKNGVFDFTVEDCGIYLPFEFIKEFVNEGVTKESWEETVLSDDNVIEDIKNYMDFAWEKANDCRGLSASRSLSHFESWIWLLNDGFYEEIIDDIKDYQYYGKDVLVQICERYGINYTQWDDGIRSNSEY